MDTPPPEHSVVGDDGELLQADPKSSPVKYAAYVAQSTPAPAAEPQTPVDRAMNRGLAGCLILLATLCGLIIFATQTYQFTDNPNASPAQNAQAQADAPQVLYQTDLESPLHLPLPGQVMAADLGASLKDVRWSPDGTKIATLDADDNLRIWRVSIGLPLPYVALKATTFDWSPDGRELITAYDTSMVSWDAASGMILRRYPPFAADEAPLFLRAASVGNQLALLTANNHLLVMNYKNGARTDTQTLAVPLAQVDWSPDGKSLIAVFNHSVWHWRDGKVDTQSRTNDTIWYSAHWSPDGQQVVMTGEAINTSFHTPMAAGFGAFDGGIFDSELGLASEWSNELMPAQSQSVVSSRSFQAQWSPDGTRIMAFISGGRVLYMLGRTSDGALPPSYVDPFMEGVTAAQWSPDSQRIALVSGSMLLFWSPDAGS
jgi:WD40 repeat protein